MVAVAADDLVDVLLFLPVRLDVSRTERLSDTVEMFEGELGSPLNLLAVQVNHFVDATALVLMVENV